MPPHEGLVHLKEYDIKDSNVELIGSDIDHKVKYSSAASEPAWNNGKIGREPGLFVWRIENFEVIPLPKDKYGTFYDGDSYIVLYSYKVGKDGDEQKLGHEIFFWLGGKTSQDEAGTAAYKTVELDEFLHGVAVQHREVQAEMSDQFISLFKRIEIRKGGVQSGFTHVEQAPEKPDVTTLLRVFKHPAAAKADSVMVHEVEPTWESLDEDDVFILDKGDKIWVWQGKNCSPMEKAKAAQVVHDMTIAKHVDTEILSQAESRSRVIVNLLGGKDAAPNTFSSSRPTGGSKKRSADDSPSRPRRLFRLSDASGTLSFDLVKEKEAINQSDLDGNDIFLLDAGKAVWVWEGQNASKAEQAMWIKVAQSYVRQLQEASEDARAPFTPVAKVVEGNESPAFFKALEVA